MKNFTKNLFLILILITALTTNAQIKIGDNPSTINPSAMLEIESVTKGFRLPRMTTAQRVAIPSPADGLQVYDSTTGTIWFRNGSIWLNMGVSNSGSTSITLNGSSFERAALTGDVTAPANSNATIIANNAVTTAKILDGTIITADMADNSVTIAKLPTGATSTSYLRGDGTWVVPSAGISTASNGLTAASGDVKLGGTLTAPTTIDGITSTNSLNFNSNATGGGTATFNNSADAGNFMLEVGSGTTTRNAFSLRSYGTTSTGSFFGSTAAGKNYILGRSNDIVIGTFVSGDIVFGTANVEKMRVNATTSNVEITNQIKIYGGSPGTGKVLTSDASGLASWSTPTSGTVTSVTGTLPISISTGTTTPAISIATANTTTTGAISSTDWTSFNSKVGTASNGLTVTSGDVKLGGTLSAATTISGVTDLSFEAPAATITSNIYYRNPNEAGRALFTVKTGSTTSLDFRSQGTTYTETRLGNSVSGKNLIFSIGGLLLGTSNLTDVVFGTNDSERMRLTSTGNLELTNQIKIYGGSPGTGKVLTSDASGLASWSTPAINGTVTSVTGTSPISVTTGTTTPAISIATANTTTTGAISSTDWTTFNSKVGTASNGLTVTSGDVKLGGTLSAATTIDGISSTNSLSFSANSGGNTSARFNNIADAGNMILGIEAGTTAGTTTATGFSLRSYGPTSPGSFFGSAAAGKNYIFAFASDIVIGTYQNGNLIFGTNDAEKMRVNATTSNVELTNQIKIAGGSPGSGKVLTSDATGLASWSTPTTGTVTSVTGTLPISISTGTTTPAISIATANTTTTGAISSTDWTNFNSKVGTASNGLTVTTGDVKLGGALTAPTTISGLTATNKLAITGTGVNAFNVASNTLSVDATNNRVGFGTAAPLSLIDAKNTTSGGWIAASFTSDYGGLTVLQTNSDRVVVGNFQNKATIGAHNSALGAWSTLSVNPGNLTEFSTIKITGGTPAVGKVLISDASGLASWSTPTSGTVTSVTGTLPISISTGTTTPAISIATANATTTGAISSTDWTSFNSKVGTASNGLTATSGDVKLGGTLNGATTIGGVTNLTFQAPAATTDAYIDFTNPIENARFVHTVRTGSASKLYLISNGTSYVDTKFGNSVAGKNTITSMGALLFGTSNANEVVFGTNDAERMRLTSAGNLEINNQIKIYGGSPGSGKVLTSDASGLASWTTPSSGTVSSVTGTLPISVATGTSTPAISIATANATTTGAISSTDWTTFNSKVGTASNGLTVTSGDVQLGGTLSAATTIGGVTDFTFEAPAASINSNVNLKNPSETGRAIFTVKTGATTSLDFRSQGATYSETRLGNSVSGKNLIFSIGGLLLGTYNLTDIVFGTNDAERMRLTSTGNLELTNQIKIYGGSPGSGKVLTSDATGLSSWSTPAIGTVSNGLTATSGDVKLGGTLSAATTIAQGTNTLDFTGSGRSTFAGNVTVGGNTTSTSKLEVKGSISTAQVTTTAAITLVDTHSTVFCDTTTAGFTVTLPAASTCIGRNYTIIKNDATYNVLTFNLPITINDTTITTTNIPFYKISIQSNGSNWVKVN